MDRRLSVSNGMKRRHVGKANGECRKSPAQLELTHHPTSCQKTSRRMVCFHLAKSLSLLRRRRPMLRRRRIYVLARLGNSAPASLMLEDILIRNQCSIATMTPTKMDHVALHQAVKYDPAFSLPPQHLPIHILIIALSPSPSATPSVSMNTRRKNKSAHPGIPDMTPSQLASAGLPLVKPTRPKPTLKKLSMKDQKIADLEEELRAAQAIIVIYFSPP